jgi:hypothetical protein
MRISLFAAALAATTATAMAQTVTPIAMPFTGDRTEDFEIPNSTAFPQCIDNGVFETPGGMDWAASLCAPSGSAHITGGWGFSCSIGPHSGSRFCGSTGGPLIFDFSLGGQDISQFGGYFGSNSPGSGGVNGMTVKFFDGNGTQIGADQVVVFASCGVWGWYGWQITGAAARTVEVRSNYSSGGFTDIDDLECTFAGPSGPVVYCTAGTTTNNCVPSIAASGNPNVTHTNACTITATNVEGQKSGIVFYGLAQNVVPWCSSGGTSFLCVKPPTQRTAVQMSGGTNNACDGILSLDWNAFQLANPGALGNPWSAGDTADVQAWFRDPPACKTTNLSDAVELTYQP